MSTSGQQINTVFGGSSQLGFLINEMKLFRGQALVN